MNTQHRIAGNSRTPWLASILRDQSGDFTAADKIKALEEDTRLALIAPKYDPCREFRAGDKVELKTNLGRNPYDTFDGQEYIPDGTVFTVLRDEWACGKVDIFEKDESDAFTVHFSNLELVTPVEELETAAIFNDRKTGMWVVTKDNFTHAYFPYRMEVSDNIANSEAEAKALAEAERDRLNAEYRKERG